VPGNPSLQKNNPFERDFTKAEQARKGRLGLRNMDEAVIGST
jgi:hypothetical protein